MPRAESRQPDPAAPLDSDAGHEREPERRQTIGASNGPGGIGRRRPIAIGVAPVLCMVPTKPGKFILAAPDFEDRLFYVIGGVCIRGDGLLEFLEELGLGNVEAVEWRALEKFIVVQLQCVLVCQRRHCRRPLSPDLRTRIPGLLFEFT